MGSSLSQISVQTLNYLVLRKSEKSKSRASQSNYSIVVRIRTGFISIADGTRYFLNELFFNLGIGHWALGTENGLVGTQVGIRY